nr:recombinase family protein [Enterobacter hormaechei]
MESVSPGRKKLRVHAKRGDSWRSTVFAFADERLSGRVYGGRIDELRQRGIHFKSLTDSIDTSSPMGRFIFHIMSALAEMERELIVERTRAGLAAAREKGRIGGRRPKLTPEQWAQAGRLISNGLDRKQVAIIYDVAVCSLYKKFPASKPA